jgi:hypothetical protein
MAVTAFSSGTQTCTVTTEHFVADIDEAGVFVFEVDLNAAVDGDVFELRVYKMILTSGTSRVLYPQRFYGAQATDDKIKTSLPIVNELTDATAIRCSIKQTFGTSRNIPWKVLKAG